MYSISFLSAISSTGGRGNPELITAGNSLSRKLCETEMILQARVRLLHRPKTGFWEITPDRLASVYECFPFIWPYDAQPVLLKKSTGTRTERRLLVQVIWL